MTLKQHNALLELIRIVQQGFSHTPLEEKSKIAMRRIEEAINEKDGARAYQIIGLWKTHGDDELIKTYSNAL